MTPYDHVLELYDEALDCYEEEEENDIFDNFSWPEV